MCACSFLTVVVAKDQTPLVCHGHAEKKWIVCKNRQATVENKHTCLFSVVVGWYWNSDQLLSKTSVLACGWVVGQRTNRHWKWAYFSACFRYWLGVYSVGRIGGATYETTIIAGVCGQGVVLFCYLSLSQKLLCKTGMLRLQVTSTLLVSLLCHNYRLSFILS